MILGLFCSFLILGLFAPIKTITPVREYLILGLFCSFLILGLFCSHYDYHSTAAAPSAASGAASPLDLDKIDDSIFSGFDLPPLTFGSNVDPNAPGTHSQSYSLELLYAVHVLGR